jgi:copper oxidase (laccase) domain-containing protein
MQNQFGTSPADLVAAIGPSIGGCCYQVGDEVASQFETWLPEMGQGCRLLDLRRVNALQLAGAGVQDVWVASDCTFCKPGYWSFRRDREGAGRMLSFIGASK